MLFCLELLASCDARPGQPGLGPGSLRCCSDAPSLAREGSPTCRFQGNGNGPVRGTHLRMSTSCTGPLAAPGVIGPILAQESDGGLLTSGQNTPRQHPGHSLERCQRPRLTSPADLLLVLDASSARGARVGLRVEPLGPVGSFRALYGRSPGSRNTCYVKSVLRVHTRVARTARV